MAIEYFWDLEQNSDAWLQIRSGCITASVMSDIMAKPREPGKGMRRNLLLRLAGERITGEPSETYRNSAMDRGHRLEPEARKLFAMLTDEEVKQVGFVKNGTIGCSPDSLVGDNAGLEIKTVKAEIMIEILQRTDPPPEHHWQTAGSMLVTERDMWSLMIYCHPKMPHRIFPIRRDPAACVQLKSEIARFQDDLDRLVEQVKRYGQ